jgi:hypothetical protein
MAPLTLQEQISEKKNLMVHPLTVTQPISKVEKQSYIIWGAIG